MVSHLRPVFLSLLFVSAVPRIEAADTSDAGPDFTKLAGIPPVPSLAAAADARKIPLTGIDPGGTDGVLNPGDSATAIITLCEKGGRRTQWLLYLVALQPSDKTAAKKAPSPLVLYSGTSNKLEFASAPAEVCLQTLGPFTASSKSPKFREQSDNFSLDKGFLRLGIDRAAATLWRASKISDRGSLYIGPEPPSTAQLTQGRKYAERVHITTDEERAIAGSIPALFSYFAVIEHVEGLEDIMLKVVRKPSIWSVVRHVGVSVDFRFDDKHLGPANPALWCLPDASAIYHFPMLLSLNHQLALTVTFDVTNPRPPLLSSGGIVGLLAEKPGDKETYLTLRIVSAHLAPTLAAGTNRDSSFR
jgi:hypothetical protein